ncbi:MAG: proline--tRNA ligase [Flavobacteriales bacterium]|nr:proline--tRNA ligase [Flavobacteriales bacterium]
MAKKITSRDKDYSQWYNDIINEADLAENSGVRGCMVIKPYGFAIWEKMQSELDKMFKETGHQNAYFPLFIPKSYFSKEANHVDGFAKECAVVTHYRLKNDEENGGIIVDDTAKLEEELIVRPTSETIIWDTYRKWIQSYRDLPILVNQWANVVRWEMRTRMFLRTSEFLWQEGHTAHAKEEEAIEETEKMIGVYSDFAEKFMAMPVIVGKKTKSERFAGALETYTIEAMMQDGKALQAGTSHFLGQNFAKAFDVKYTNTEGKQEYVWATSWGVSTRLMGALIMSHSDDFGLVLPPKLAPFAVVIVPIFKTDDEFDRIYKLSLSLKESLKSVGVSCKLDFRKTHKPGWKFAEYELKGVPLRISIGPRDLQNNTLEIARRDTLEKSIIDMDDVINIIPKYLDSIQKNLYHRAIDLRKSKTFETGDYNEFKNLINSGGFVYAFWDGSNLTEEKIKNETKATIRCIPIESDKFEGKCIYSGKSTRIKVVFAKSY